MASKSLEREILQSKISEVACTQEMHTPLISVIVPVFNVENYIANCLLSLLDQTLKNIEIIVINDGSTDGSGEIIKLFEVDKRLKVIEQKNLGVSKARNAGLNIARGDYIGFVDSDDWVDDDYYEKLYKSISEQDADIAVSSVIKHKKKYKRYNVLYKKEICALDCTEKIDLCQDRTKRLFNIWNKLYKKELIDNHNLRFPEDRVFEDVAFSIRAIFYAKKIVSVPKILYHYIERDFSIVNSKDNTGKKKKDHIAAYNDLIEFAKQNNIILPERLNYSESYWKTPLIKVYKGRYRQKITLFGLIPIRRYF